MRSSEVAHLTVQNFVAFHLTVLVSTVNCLSKLKLRRERVRELPHGSNVRLGLLRHPSTRPIQHMRYLPLIALDPQTSTIVSGERKGKDKSLLTKCKELSWASVQRALHLSECPRVDWHSLQIFRWCCSSEKVDSKGKRVKDREYPVHADLAPLCGFYSIREVISVQSAIFLRNFA